MKMKFDKRVAVIAAALAFASAFATDSGTGSMGVTASIAEECSIGNVAALDFGQLSMLAAGAPTSGDSASTAGGTFDAICTSGTTTPKLKFTSANTAGADFRLKGADGTSYMVYTLAESGGTAIAYDTAAAFTGFLAEGDAKSLAITGSIAASEKTGKAKQAYSDTITITSSFGI